MTQDELQSFFGWMTLINMGILLYWWIVIARFRDGIRKLHGKWFPISEERFNEVHYAGMALLKLGITLFNFVPWLALKIIS